MAQEQKSSNPYPEPPPPYSAVPPASNPNYGMPQSHPSGRPTHPPPPGGVPVFPMAGGYYNMPPTSTPTLVVGAPASGQDNVEEEKEENTSENKVSDDEASTSDSSNDPEENDGDAVEQEPCQSNEDEGKRPTRKRKKQGDWAKVERSKSYNLGKIKRKNGVEKQRSVRGNCINKEKCIYKCTTHITTEQQMELNKCFWEMGSKASRANFICGTVTKEGIKSMIYHGSNNRQNVFKYYFSLSMDNRIRVCKQFYINTLDISDCVVRRAIERSENPGFFHERAIPVARKKITKGGRKPRAKKNSKQQSKKKSKARA